MPLVKLRSQLTFLGRPDRYAESGQTDTAFKGAEDVPYVETGGFEFQGISRLSPSVRTALDAFHIDDNTFSDRGTASRRAQLGNGTKFPIGPSGEIHSFDQVRTGFNVSNRYEDIYKSTRFTGLADTYTANSPIDDMYNKFNLRDDATPNLGYAKQPFILRGIQREGSSKPQRWGIGETTAGNISSTIDIPRGGILTAGERSAIDATRISKFLITPQGINFMAKQVGYQLMNPSTENKFGNNLDLPATQIYNPLTAPLQAAANFAGIHISRHGGPTSITEAITGQGRYEQIKAAQGSEFNRLVKLKKEVQLSPSDRDNETKITVGREISLLSSKIGGPGSLLGIGGTSIKRYEDTSLRTQLGKLNSTENTGVEDLHMYSYEEPYVTRKDNTKNGKTSGLKNDSDLDTNKETSLKERYRNLPIINPDRGGTGKAGFDGGGTSEKKDGAIFNDYKRMSYGNIPESRVKKGNRDSRITDHYDFRKDGQSQELDLKKYGWDKYDNIDEIDGSIALDPSADASADNKSLIKFSIGGIKFKAYINSLSDTFSPEWNSDADQGRADSRYQYSGFERNISINFSVPIHTEDERNQVWTKLQSLARKTYPVYGNNGFYGQDVNVTVGDMYKYKMIITDLSYDWDNETPWEIDERKQAPFYTEVSISFTVVDDKPSNESKVYNHIDPITL